MSYHGTQDVGDPAKSLEEFDFDHARGLNAT